MKRVIKITDLAKAINLNIVYMGTRDTAEIDSSDLNRPGLQMSGFFEYFAVNRVQLFGMAEITYLQTLDPDTRLKRLDRFFSHSVRAHRPQPYAAGRIPRVRAQIRRARADVRPHHDKAEP